MRLLVFNKTKPNPKGNYEYFFHAWLWFLENNISERSLIMRYWCANDAWIVLITSIPKSARLIISAQLFIRWPLESIIFPPNIGNFHSKLIFQHQKIICKTSSFRERRFSKHVQISHINAHIPANISTLWAHISTILASYQLFRGIILSPIEKYHFPISRLTFVIFLPMGRIFYSFSYNNHSKHL